MEASAGRLEECSEQEICRGNSTKNEIARLVGNYQWGELKFTALMVFETHTNTLSRVVLKLDDVRAAGSLVDVMRAAYREPEITRRIYPWELMVWSGQVDRMSITVIEHQGVWLAYQPKLPSKEARRGLGAKARVA